MLQAEVEDREVLEEWLTSKRGQKVSIRVPKKEQKRSWWNWAQGERAACAVPGPERIKREEGRTIGAVKEVAALLGLKGIVRMEAYDISNTNGFESVGSMVVYEHGRPKRNDYRSSGSRGSGAPMITAA